MFDEGDKAIIKETAYEVANIIKEEIEKTFIQQIELHQARCKAVKTIEMWPRQMRSLIVGVAIGASLAGSGSMFVILKLFCFLK